MESARAMTAVMVSVTEPWLVSNIEVLESGLGISCEPRAKHGANEAAEGGCVHNESHRWEYIFS